MEWKPKEFTMDRQPGKQRGRWSDRQTDGQTDTQHTDRHGQIDRQTDRQTDRQALTIRLAVRSYSAVHTDTHWIAILIRKARSAHSTVVVEITRFYNSVWAKVFLLSWIPKLHMEQGSGYINPASQIEMYKKIHMKFYSNDMEFCMYTTCTIM